MLSTLSAEFQAAAPYAKSFSPKPLDLLRVGLPARLGKTAFVSMRAYKASKLISSGVPVTEVIGAELGRKVTRKLTGRIRSRVKAAHLTVAKQNYDIRRKNGLGGRSWISKPGRYTMTMVFHDANRAGPHVDVHIGRFSMVYRVKPEVYSQIKYNREGYLTENSRKLLIEMVRSEIANGARVPQNLDHSITNARSTWVLGDRNGKHYGAGPTRQVIASSDVDVFKAHDNGPIEMYAPLLSPHRSTYIYKLYNGDSKRAPILIWGIKRAHPGVLEDRLHLKMVDPQKFAVLNANEDDSRHHHKYDFSTMTAKYDGSSAYIVIGPKGTTAWSPRISKVTGEHIEYTFKLDGIASVTSPETIVAMGEVMFKDQDGNYLPQATGSGILNSNLVVPKGIKPEVRLYRVDKIGRQKTVDLNFWENRALQESVAKLDPKRLKTVELMDLEQARNRGFEGVVVAGTRQHGTIPVGPDGEEWPVLESSPINEGYKIKWWTDPHDWVITKVDFRPGEKGGIAGVVEAVNDKGKIFKLGPGQVGDRALTEHMMKHPHRYEGVVLKVQSRHGHEGRAAKVLAIHDDKGFAPV